MILLSGIAGFVSALVVMGISHIAPRFGLSAFRRDMDEAKFRGKEFSHRESHVIGFLIHTILYTCFGIFFGVAETYGIFSVSFSSIAMYALYITIFLGGVVIPLEGHGLFGWNEDHWFCVDLLVMDFIWAFLFGAMLLLV